jgi:hypothetical protein
LLVGFFDKIASKLKMDFLMKLKPDLIERRFEKGKIGNS